MAVSLTPNEQVARALVLLHQKDPMSALQMMSATSDAIAGVIDNNPDPSDEEINEAIQAAIQALGYATDQESLGTQYDYLREHHAGFWSGNYTLIDSGNDVHALLVNSTNVRLLLDGIDEAFDIPSEGGGFANRTLTVDNDKVAVALDFATSVDEADLASSTADMAALADRFQVTVSGTLTIKSDAAQARTVRGKRGVSTPAGVLHEKGEEPSWIWAGDYQLRYTDTELWELHDDLLTIGHDAATQALSVRLGAVAGKSVVYANSAISCKLELKKGVDTRVTMEMHATSGGKRKCYLWFETTGQIRTLTGYAITLLARDALWQAPAVQPQRLMEARP